jgi:hypothetical protein
VACRGSRLKTIVFGSRWKVRSIRLVANALHDDFSLVSRFPRVSIFARWVFSLPALNETLGNAALPRPESYSTIGNEGVVLRISHGDDLAVTFRYIGTPAPLGSVKSSLFLPFRFAFARQLTNRRPLVIQDRKLGTFRLPLQPTAHFGNGDANEDETCDCYERVITSTNGSRERSEPPDSSSSQIDDPPCRQMTILYLRPASTA